MDKQDKLNLIRNATEKIWGDFQWLSENCNTEYLTGEYTINDNYSIYAYDETDTLFPDDRWINITVERYNNSGKCVDEYAATFCTESFSKWALWSGIYHVVNKFKEKFDLSLLECK